MFFQLIDRVLMTIPKIICIYSIVDKRLADLNPVQLVQLICNEEKIETGIGIVCRIYGNHLCINK